MGVYHQMGHDSWNLIDEKPLNGFAGIILSPVNDTPDEVIQKISLIKSPPKKFEIILDPQFYEPRTARGHLSDWSHFSEDVDTVDLGDLKWWDGRATALVSVAKAIGAHAICSPAFCPKNNAYDDSYFSWVVECANRANIHAADAKLDVLLTAIVGLSELAKKGRPQAIASRLTATDISRVYLVFADDLPPRTQRTNVEALGGAVLLIRLLEEAGSQVLVAFSGLDMLLWKAAGATNVASGKFFNLRRFVPGRFQKDAQEGGRVVPYWTDGPLVTWLREDDVRMLDRRGIISRKASVTNPYSQRILDILDAGEGKPWVGEGWRQYLYWLQETESNVSGDIARILSLLKAADSAWGAIATAEIYLYDRQNTGEWIRPWLNAIKIGLEDE